MPLTGWSSTEELNYAFLGQVNNERYEPKVSPHHSVPVPLLPQTSGLDDEDKLSIGEDEEKSGDAWGNAW